MSTVKRVTVLEPISSQVVYDNTTEAPKLKVAAYARVSTEQDEQQSSYEAQVNYYNQTIFYKGIMPSEKILDLPVDCNFLTGSVNL